MELLSAQEPALPLLFLPCLTDAGSVSFVLQVHVSVHAVTTQCCWCHHDCTLTACDSREFAIQPRCMIVRHLPLLPAHAGGTVSYTAQHNMHVSCPLLCSVYACHQHHVHHNRPCAAARCTYMVFDLCVVFVLQVPSQGAAAHGGSSQGLGGEGAVRMCFVPAAVGGRPSAAFVQCEWSAAPVPWSCWLQYSPLVDSCTSCASRMFPKWLSRHLRVLPDEQVLLQ